MDLDEGTALSKEQAMPPSLLLISGGRLQPTHIQIMYTFKDGPGWAEELTTRYALSNFMVFSLPFLWPC